MVPLASESATSPAISDCCFAPETNFTPGSSDCRISKASEVIDRALGKVATFFELTASWSRSRDAAARCGVITKTSLGSRPLVSNLVTRFFIKLVLPDPGDPSTSASMPDKTSPNSAGRSVSADLGDSKEFLTSSIYLALETFFLP